MIRARFFVLATIGGLALCAAATQSCKTNNISDNTNNNQTSVYQTFQVGPAGAHLDGPNGCAVDIPMNALSQQTEIKLGSLAPNDYPAPLPAGLSLKGSVFSFEPHGLTFSASVTISVPYTAASSSGLRLAYSDTSGNWQAVPGAQLTTGKAVVQSPHFSFYAVVSGLPPDDSGSPSGDDGGGDGAVSDADAEGGSSDPAVLYTGGDAFDFAVSGSTLYVGTGGGSFNTGSLYSCPRTGCPKPPTTMYQRPMTAPYGIGTLAIYNQNIYFMGAPGGDQGAPIMTCPLSGCGAGPTTIYDNTDNDTLRGLTAGQGGVVFGAIVTGTLITQKGWYSCPLGGCPSGQAPSDFYASALGVASTYDVESSSGTAMLSTRTAAPLNDAGLNTFEYAFCSLAGGACPADAGVAVSALWGVGLANGSAVYAHPFDGPPNGDAGASTGAIYTCAASNCPGTMTPLATMRNYPYNVATDGTTAYWIDTQAVTANPPVGNVYKCALSGCGNTPTVMATMQGAGNISRVGVDDTYVYWIAGGNVYSLPK